METYNIESIERIQSIPVEPVKFFKSANQRTAFYMIGRVKKVHWKKVKRVKDIQNKIQLTHFGLLFPIYTPWTSKDHLFFFFSESIKREPWFEMS